MTQEDRWILPTNMDLTVGRLWRPLDVRVVCLGGGWLEAGAILVMTVSM